MNFLQQLQTHRGSLICLKTQLYWYDGRKWDNTPGRICLLLDATDVVRPSPTAATTAAATAAEPAAAAAHLLIDGQPVWIWVVEKDIELLVNDQPIN